VPEGAWVVSFGGERMDWLNLKTTIGLIGAVLAGVLCNMLGGWDVWLKALVLFVVLDYISGVLAAATEKRLNSEIGYKGIIKKVFIFVLVAIAFQVDVLVRSEIIRIAVIGFYLGTEGLSILENAGKAGLPLPEPLRQALIQLRGEEKGEVGNV
jgi:toxin secretion/phage lysis holin